MRGSRSPRLSRCATAASSPSEPMRSVRETGGASHAGDRCTRPHRHSRPHRQPCPRARRRTRRGRHAVPHAGVHRRSPGLAPRRGATNPGAVMGVVDARLPDAVARGAIPDATGARRRRAGPSGGGGWRVRLRPEHAGARGRRHHCRHARSAGGGHRARSGRRAHRPAAEREAACSRASARPHQAPPLSTRSSALHRAYLATGITSIVERGGKRRRVIAPTSVSRPPDACTSGRRSR